MKDFLLSMGCIDENNAPLTESWIDEYVCL